MNKKRKIPITFNIGTVIFGAILVYLVIFLVLYYTSNHVTYYRVTTGPLSKNETYTGFALRNEEVICSYTSGYVHYYAENGTKIKKYGPLYGTGTQETMPAEKEISSSVKSDIKNSVKSFSLSFNPISYDTVNSLKYDISGKIVAESDSLSGYDMSTVKDNFTIGDVTVSTAPTDGIVLYTVDGYENYDLNTLSSDITNKNAYNSTQLKKDGKISAGDSICKIIKSEDWSLLIPLTNSQEVRLNSLSSVKVKFLEDGTTENAVFSILTSSDGKYFGKLDFKNGMIRYANERYVDIELVTNTKTGLKIPISSVCTKEFFTIPEEFVTSKDDDGGDVGFMKEVKNNNGTSSAIFVSTTLYEHIDGKYYIDSSEFNTGDVIVMKNSENERYIINNTASIEGVYCINKGYAVFRKISIIDKNEEYCIVETGTKYGVSQYDYIVLNASEVNEEQIVVN